MNAAPPPAKDRIIAVSSDLIDLAGDGNAAIFLAQVLFWWKAAGRQKFYKFNSPCDHPLYRQGDSWMEELRFRRAMFCTARKRVATKVRISCDDEIDVAFGEGVLIVYGTDEHHLTWYIVNEAVIRSRHPQLFTRLFPNDPAPAAPVQKSRALHQANPPASATPIPTGHVADGSDSVHRNATDLPVVGTLHCPMQEPSSRIPTEKTSEKTPESWGRTKLYQSKHTQAIPLPTPPLYIGYERLDEWVSVIDPAASVYVNLLVEEVHPNEADRRIDHHRLLVGQPDARNRVHYCRMTLATLVYINEVPFDPEHAQVLVEAKRVYEQIAMWLQRDFTVWHGMVAMPEGLIQAEGVVPHNLLSLLEDHHADS